MYMYIHNLLDTWGYLEIRYIPRIVFFPKKCYFIAKIIFGEFGGIISSDKHNWIGWKCRGHHGNIPIKPRPLVHLMNMHLEPH